MWYVYYLVDPYNAMCFFCQAVYSKIYENFRSAVSRGVRKSYANVYEVSFEFLFYFKS
jgi:hypothetical protein